VGDGLAKHQLKKISLILEDRGKKAPLDNERKREGGKKKNPPGLTL